MGRRRALIVKHVKTVRELSKSHMKPHSPYPDLQLFGQFACTFLRSKLQHTMAPLPNEPLFDTYLVSVVCGDCV
jgi:hypothetical protein